MLLHLLPLCSLSLCLRHFVIFLGGIGKLGTQLLQAAFLLVLCAHVVLDLLLQGSHVVLVLLDGCVDGFRLQLHLVGRDGLVFFLLLQVLDGLL